MLSRERATTGIRTRDLLLTMEALYQLSYRSNRGMANPRRLESFTDQHQRAQPFQGYLYICEGSLSQSCRMQKRWQILQSRSVVWRSDVRFSS